MGEHPTTLTRKLFSFDGRLRRRDWWLLSIVLGTISFVVSDAARHALMGPQASVFTAGWGAVMTAAVDQRTGWIGLAVSMLFGWPSFAMAAKRVHDRGKSARMMMIVLAGIWVWNIVTVVWPNLFVAVDGGLGPGTLIYLAGMLVGFVGALYYFIVCGILGGDAGPNRFGPSPKAHEQVDG